MTLISCSNSTCSKKVSSNAVACPSCGAIIKASSDVETASDEHELNILVKRLALRGEFVGSKIMVIGGLSQEVIKSYNQIKMKHARNRKVVTAVSGALVAALALASPNNKYIQEEMGKNLGKVIGTGAIMGGVMEFKKSTDIEEAVEVLSLAEQIEFIYLVGFRLIQNSNKFVVFSREDLSTEQQIWSFTRRSFQRLRGNF